MARLALLTPPRHAPQSERLGRSLDRLDAGLDAPAHLEQQQLACPPPASYLEPLKGTGPKGKAAAAGLAAGGAPMAKAKAGAMRDSGAGSPQLVRLRIRQPASPPACRPVQARDSRSPVRLSIRATR